MNLRRQTDTTPRPMRANLYKSFVNILWEVKNELYRRKMVAVLNDV